MNAIVGVPLNRVHGMVNDVEDRIGLTRCGAIRFTSPHNNGRYFIAFYGRDAADLFERLHRQTGRAPRRLQRLPENIVIIPIETELQAVILKSLEAFVRYMQSRLN
jgi:hypothetical protein